MPDATAAAAPSAADATVAVARLEALSGELRGCVVLDRDGEPEEWGAAARALLAAADAAAGEPARAAHVGTEDGEVFAVRERGYAIVAACDRFVLASLMAFDLRAVLRDLVRGPAALPAAARERG